MNEGSCFPTRSEAEMRRVTAETLYDLETECPRCGREIDRDAATVIRVGGGPTPGLQS